MDWCGSIGPWTPGNDLSLPSYEGREIYRSKSYGLLVYLGFAIADFTPDTYQRLVLP
jgi:hypothetical protein